MQNGQKVTFPGEADEVPETITGGIVFFLQQKEHPKFKRMGDDLFVEYTSTLAEALCGYQFILTHLDNRKLLIKSQPGEIAKPDQFKAINDEGMPMYQRPFMRGKLYIHLTIDFRVITRAMKQQAAQEAYDEDDDGGAQRVQCV
ncbi:hypothetical protein K7X08_032895 [Anisodus acutangulus]|uniref:Chaperone DnaJ C-terminal domain-containing protein n=1 Tax=Anisodus acutangulus TaxID=402998 RepID=A0A9Q1M3X8_9SOLA|nr:hypothetical protein K7X08_032895 [Anisodus acutangulus]